MKLKLLSALTLLLGIGTPCIAGVVTAPAQISTTPYLSQILGATPAAPVVATRSGWYDNNFTFGADIQSTGCSSATYRKRYVVTANTPVLILEYGNSGSRISADWTEYDGANTITVKASVEYTENASQVVVLGQGITGQNTLSIDPGCKNYLYVWGNWIAGQAIFVRTYVVGGTNRTVTDAGQTSGGFNITSATAAFTSADVGRWVSMTGSGAAGATITTQITVINSATSAGVTTSNTSGGTVTNQTLTMFNVWPAATNLDPTASVVNPNGGGSAEGATANTDLTGVTTAVGANFVAAYGPLAILGYPSTVGASRATVALLGDSIFRGIHLDTDQDNTYVQKALTSAGVGVKNLSKDGEWAGDTYLTSLIHRRMSFLNGCTAAVTNLGTNDMYTHSQTPDVVWTNLKSLCANLQANGIANVWLVDLTPRTASTDIWLTLGNQTPVATTVSSTINGATNATPIVVSTTAANHWVTGEQVVIASVGGNTNANGTFYVSGVDSTHAGLYSDVNLNTPIAGNAPYTSGGSATVTYEQERQALNALERLNWRTAGLRGFIDVAAGVEVNSSGASITTSSTTGFVTNTGGLWPVPASPAFTEASGAGITSSNGSGSWIGDTGLSGTLTSNYQFDCYAIQITAGNGTPAIAALVTSKTGSPPKIFIKNGSGVVWTGSLPDTTTNYKLWSVYTIDGVHPACYAGASALQALVPVSALSVP